MRIYNLSLGKFLSVDLMIVEYLWNLIYVFVENRLIDGIDLEGKEWFVEIKKDGMEVYIV